MSETQLKRIEALEAALSRASHTGAQDTSFSAVYESYLTLCHQDRTMMDEIVTPSDMPLIQNLAHAVSAMLETKPTAFSLRAFRAGDGRLLHGMFEAGKRSAVFAAFSKSNLALLAITTDSSAQKFVRVTLVPGIPTIRRDTTPQ